MADDIAFALIVDDPDMVSLIEWQGICWPYKSRTKAREMAKRIGAPGIWNLKPRANV